MGCRPEGAYFAALIALVACGSEVTTPADQSAGAGAAASGGAGADGGASASNGVGATGAASGSTGAAPGTSASSGVGGCWSDGDCPPGTACQLWSCQMGACTEHFLPVGTQCASQACCDASGECTTECASDSDCPRGGECFTTVCSECGTCEDLLSPAGTLTPQQVPGDCSVVVCDGMGGAFVSADDTDVSDDGDPCTIDACINGAPVHTALCPAPQTCVQGMCVP